MAKKAYVYDGSAWVEITSQPSVATGTTTSPGIIQLQDSVSSTSTSYAATPNAVKSAYDRGSQGITDAATAQTTANAAVPKTTTLTGTAPITIAGVSGTGQDLSANRTIAVTSASTSASGVVQLSDSTSTTSSVLAATPTAVKSAYDLANAAIPKSVATASGDILYATAASTITKLGIGTDGQVLTLASGLPSWATPSASGGARVLLASSAENATDVVISNIPSTYSDIEIILWGNGALDTDIRTFVCSAGSVSNGATAYGGFNQAAFIAGNDTSSTYQFPRSTALGPDGGNHNVAIIRMPDFSNKSGANSATRIMYSQAMTPPGSSTVAVFTFHVGRYTMSTATAGITGFTVNKTASVGMLVYGIP